MCSWSTKKTFFESEKKLYCDTNIAMYAHNEVSVGPIFCEESDAGVICHIHPLQRLWEANLSDLNCYVGADCMLGGRWQLLVDY